MDFHPRIDGVFHPYFLFDVHPDLERKRTADLAILVFFYFPVLVPFHPRETITLHEEMCVPNLSPSLSPADRLKEVVVDANVLIAFGVDEDLFRALFVLEAEFVEASYPFDFAGAALD